MDIRRRPLRPQELSRFSNAVVARPPWTTMVIPATGIGVVAMLATMAVSELWGLRGAVPGIAAFTLLTFGTLGSLLFLILQSNQRVRLANEHYDADRRAGYVEEWHVRVRDAIRVDEFEDERSQYFLGLDDGRVLFLAGHYLYPLEATGRFPCSELKLARLPHSREIVDIECLGAPVTVSMVRPPFTSTEHHLGAVPLDGEVLEGPLFRFRHAKA